VFYVLLWKESRVRLSWCHDSFVALVYDLSVAYKAAAVVVVLVLGRYYFYYYEQE